MTPGRCPLCGPAPSRSCLGPLVPDGSRGVAFTVRACIACGALFCDPALELTDVPDYYGADYAPYAAPPPPSPLTRGFRSILMALRDLARRGNPLRRMYGEAYRFLWKDYALPVPRPWGTRRALELGCGAGDYLARLRSAGWDVTGLDPSPSAALEAERRHGLRVHLRPLQALDDANASFQLAVAWEVVEHLQDPVGDLSALARRMAPDGLLMLSTANAASPERRLFGRYWLAYDVPRHLALFGPAQLRELLRRAGFHAVRFDYLWHADNWMASLRSAARGAPFPRRARDRLAEILEPSRMDVKLPFLAPAFVLAALRAAGRIRVMARRNP
jgi:SAM-dependent methyltransferase